MLSQILAVALCALAAQPAAASSCSRTYTVKEGDICDSISAANNVSTYQLAVYNMKKIDGNCDNLVPGEKLCLGKKGADCKTTYVVGEGDTCGSITSATGVNSTLLNLNNPQINDGCTNIYVGEVLCTAKTAAAPPVPSDTKSVPIPSPSTEKPAKAASGKSGPGKASLANGNDNGDGGNGGDDDGDDDDKIPFCDEL